jgi:hypothetical protein
MPGAGFEPAIPATKRPQTYALEARPQFLEYINLRNVGCWQFIMSPVNVRDNAGTDIHQGQNCFKNNLEVKINVVSATKM